MARKNSEVTSRSTVAENKSTFRMEVGRAKPPRARKRAPGRPTTKQAEDLKNAVLHAALHAFMTKGFEAASIEGIARAAKVAKITLYRQFETKEKLFYEVTRYAQADIRQSLQAAVDLDVPPEDMLRSLILSLYDGMTHPNYIAVLRMAISEAERFPSVATGMLHDADFILEPIIGYLHHLKAKGLIDVESPRDAAIQLSCLVGGGARYLMVRPTNLPTARLHWADSLCKLFFRAWNLKPATAATRARRPAVTSAS